MQRESKLGGSDFVQGLVFGWLHAPAATTEDLTRLLERRDVSMSASGLCQRFTAEAATLLFKVLEEVAQEDIQAEQADPYRSLFKAAKQVREYAPDLLSALNGEIRWSRLLTRLVRTMQACRVHRRRSHPCHAQLVLEGLDWELA